MAKCFSRLGVLCVMSLAAWSSGAESGAVPASSADALQRQRSQFIENFQRIGLNTAPEDAQFLRLMVELAGSKRGVEVGTATGYGAIHMGLAFEANGGELISVDIDSKMVATARENIARVKLEKTVSVIEGDALKVLPKLEGKFDFAFLDAVKKDYLRYFQDLEPLLEPGALIIADNVIRSARDMQDFLSAVRQDPNYRMVIIRASELKNDGMAVIRKLK